MKSLKGLKLMPLSVYRDGHNCTNGGVTAKNDTIYMVHPEGFLDAEKEDRALIFEEERRGENYMALIPFDKEREDMMGPTFGGNLAATSDSRVKYTYHVHDRYDTWEHYDRMSR